MKEITLSTNMHCGNCVAKLGNVLDKDPRIHHWFADVESQNKSVTVHGTNTSQEVTSLIEQAGFSTNAVTNVQCEMHPGTTGHIRSTFWGDHQVWKRASSIQQIALPVVPLATLQ